MSADTFQIRDNRGGDRYFIDNCLIREYGKTLGVYGIAVYNVIAMHANSDTQAAYPSYNTIADMIGCSRNKVIDTIKQLKELGMLAVSVRFTEDGDRDSNLLTLLNKDVWGGDSDLSLHAGGPQDALPSPQDAPPTHSQHNGLVHEMDQGSPQDAPKQDSPNKTNKRMKKKANSKQPDISSAAIPAPDSPKEPTPAQAMFGALADVCRVDLKLMTDKQRGELNQTEKRLRDSDIIPGELLGFAEYWYECDWRGKESPPQPPKPAQVREEWTKYQDWVKGLQAEPAAIPDHIAARIEKPQAASPESQLWQQMAEYLSGSMTKAAYDMHVKNAQPVCRNNGTLTVQAASPDSYEIVKHRLQKVFNRAASTIEAGLKVEFVLG
jgi:hypothetical protein